MRVLRLHRGVWLFGGLLLGWSVPVQQVRRTGERDGEGAANRGRPMNWKFPLHLPQRVSGLRTTSQIRTWIADAVAAGIDPL
jgi:hypothetical protein